MAGKKTRHAAWYTGNNNQISASSSSSNSYASNKPHKNSVPRQAQTEKSNASFTAGPSTAVVSHPSTSPFPAPSNKVYLGPPEKRKFNHHRSSKPTIPAISFSSPWGPDLFSKLPVELLLIVLEYLHGEDILSIRLAIPTCFRILKEQNSSKAWNTARLAAGLPVDEGKRELPTALELEGIRYALESHCMACGRYHAYRQWEFGLRLCSSCLLPRIITLRDFMSNNGDLFNNRDHLRDVIGWVYSESLPGLMGFGYGTLVARKVWVDRVVEEVASHVRYNPKPKDARRDNEIIKDKVLSCVRTLHRFRKTIQPFTVSKLTHPLALDRLSRQRQKWFGEGFLAMTAMKFIGADIPRIQESNWRQIMYKKSEPGKQDEWDERHTRLRLMVTSHRNARLLCLLQDHELPVPSSNLIDLHETNQDISERYVGKLSALVFLKICSFSDVEMVITLEQTSSTARSILRSSEAESTWQRLCLDVGLPVKYPGWSERQFLHFAFRRLCHCGSEGVTVWMFARTLCGDCFAKSVVRADEVLFDMGKDFKAGMPKLHAKLYMAWRWYNAPAGDIRLLSRDYVEAVQKWSSQLPGAIRKQLPEDFLVKHVEDCTEPFREISRYCDKWQERYFSNMDGVQRRREAAILRKIRAHDATWQAPSQLFEDPRWKQLVNRVHPFSECEWESIRDEVLKIFEAE
ncbi:hypothetical protein FRC04_004851 [Tulasnella sp. 424]|nr:hypothetical protein FRC04_004851 [Tulasnella sp. 424]KAG8963594.1 hypothetical protein FRC05_004603 [Tulasnella sp. 425]